MSRKEINRFLKALQGVWEALDSGGDRLSVTIRYTLLNLDLPIVLTLNSLVTPLASSSTLWVVCSKTDPLFGKLIRWVPPLNRVGVELIRDEWAELVSDDEIAGVRVQSMFEYYYLPGPTGPQGLVGDQGSAGPQGPRGPTGPTGDHAIPRYIDLKELLAFTLNDPDIQGILPPEVLNNPSFADLLD